LIATLAPVIAHVGHWLIGIAFGAPAVVIPLGLVVLTMRDRRQERLEAS
jgi:hypothetical protein